MNMNYDLIKILFLMNKQITIKIYVNRNKIKKMIIQMIFVQSF